MTQPDHHRPETPSDQNTKSCSQSVRELHELYCHWTAQTLSLRFDRERLWYEFLRAGFSAVDLKRVLTYLQKEIRAQRRNIGALKLSNLLQLDRFEEDSTLAASVLSPQPSALILYPSRSPTRKWTISNAAAYLSNSGSSASTWVATVRLLNPTCHNFRPLSVQNSPKPTKQRDSIPIFPRNTLTPVPRNNVARYNRRSSFWRWVGICVFPCLTGTSRSCSASEACAPIT